MPDFIVYLVFISLIVGGLVFLSNDVVGLYVKKKTGPWKEGGASLLAGAIVAGVSLGVLLGNLFWLPD